MPLGWDAGLVGDVVELTVGGLLIKAQSVRAGERQVHAEIVVPVEEEGAGGGASGQREALDLLRGRSGALARLGDDDLSVGAEQERGAAIFPAAGSELAAPEPGGARPAP